jgi:hypothetical protein
MFTGKLEIILRVCEENKLCGEHKLQINKNRRTTKMEDHRGRGFAILHSHQKLGDPEKCVRKCI